MFEGKLVTSIGIEKFQFKMMFTVIITAAIFDFDKRRWSRGEDLQAMLALAQGVEEKVLLKFAE
jgi:hypothetical protein